MYMLSGKLISVSKYEYANCIRNIIALLFSVKRIFMQVKISFTKMIQLLSRFLGRPLLGLASADRCIFNNCDKLTSGKDNSSLRSRHLVLELVFCSLDRNICFLSVFKYIPGDNTESKVSPSCQNTFWVPSIYPRLVVKMSFRLTTRMWEKE